MNAEQFRAPPPVHTPAWHASPTLQKSPSSQLEPFGSGAVQESVASLQLSAQLPSPSGPGQGLPACTAHTPAAQVSPPLQNVPSLQTVPVWFVQVPGVTPLHVTQSSGLPPPHALVQQTPSTQVVPAWHIASRVHTPPGVFTTWHDADPVLQKNPLVHWLSAEQEPWHAAPLHGVVAPHATGACEEHTPPVQVAGGIACAFGMVPEQLGATPQVVPLVTGA